MGANSNALVHTESAWVDRLFSQSEFSPQYQDLKFILHRKLLDRINLEMLSSVAVDRVRSEVRSAVARLVEDEPDCSQAAKNAWCKRTVAEIRQAIEAQGVTVGKTGRSEAAGQPMGPEVKAAAA